ncbi:hypothetical protein COHA_008063 [Chlorella ohadii]|uniref:Uncharacterized protein n=1 Tax=Chlorella ohadii TaxID=2649997 RepID=A0AAD5H3K4_9CHLO|nr:hypothetical protein COHA_008063 [Chlorella ohadii]
MEGTLFRYGPAAANVAFLSGRHPRHVVLVGGLTDGLLFAPYVRPLAAKLEERRWALVQTLLSSSHTGYGCASLDQDAEELHRLACHLRAEYGSQGMVIVGHSTGCQDAVRYAQRHRSSPSSSGGSGSSQPGSTPQQAGAAAAAAAPDAATLLGVVLQAPVSDVEFLSLLPGTAERIERAAAMAAAGQGEEIAFRATDIDGAPMTARRWLSLACPGGDDDMFSSSLSDEQLAAIFGPLRGLPSLLLLSGADQYVPPGVDYPAVGRRLAQAIGPSAQLQTVEGALHAMDGKEEEGAAAIADFVAALLP